MPRKRNYLAEIKDYYASVDPNDVIEPEEIHAAIERIREAGGTAKKSSVNPGQLKSTKKRIKPPNDKTAR